MEMEAAGGASAGATLLSFLLVGALWGCTNPLIKRGAACSRLSGVDWRPLAALARADERGMDRFAAAGSATERMYARRDNSLRELGKQALHLVKNWRVRRRLVLREGRMGRRSHVTLCVCAWQFVLPFALNQSGSVAYVALLGSTGGLS
jgi:hypothetical protein